MIHYHPLRHWSFPEIEQHYSVDDTLRYALALGYGQDPLDEAGLRFVNETMPGGPLALPTMAVVLGFPGSWMADPATGIDFAKIVHGEETLVMHRPLPAAGTVIARHRVTHVVDKGAGRGATITYDKDLYDKASGAHLATVTHTTFARGDGGFSAGDGVTDTPPAPPPKPPTREPDHRFDIATLPQQALLYRLCADRNPLHATPAVARAAGFARPILHGLCTYGLAARAVLAVCCQHDPTRLLQLAARFTAPVFPGETLRVEMYREGDGVQFRARVPERDVTVLDNGHARLAG